MRAEAYAFVGDFTELREAVDLESAGVREHGARPTDEAMETAHAAYGFVTGAEIEMIRVAKNNLRTERFNNLLRNSFYAASGADGHEHGRFDDLMRQIDLAAATAGFGRIEQVECEAHMVILSGAE